jgi:Putative prokaryotic signal transducing protein
MASGLLPDPSFRELPGQLGGVRAPAQNPFAGPVAASGASASSLCGVAEAGTVVLTVVSGEPEAEVVCGLLRSAGIECGYRDTEAIEESLEDFMAAGAREILVREADLEAAKELLADSRGSTE